MEQFPTNYAAILQRLHEVRPSQYGATRNYLDGAVTRLSPYLTHGVLTTRQVGQEVLRRATYQQAEVLLRELAWRDYYHAMWQDIGDGIMQDLRYPQPGTTQQDLPKAVIQATTGIQVIDQAISELYQHGYMHNHARMWTAMLCCAVGQTYWKQPSRWLYYHLLDGDIASNTLSWQWIAGTARQEPYIANQENLNHYSRTNQSGTFLDYAYDELRKRPMPQELLERQSFNEVTDLPETAIPELPGQVLLYHPWSLDPQWHADSKQRRIVLLEPSHFVRYPVSQKRRSFIKALAAQIPGAEVVVADFDTVASRNPNTLFCYKDHPAVIHWKGEMEQGIPLFETKKRPLQAKTSFSSFWNNATCTIAIDQPIEGN
jgi:deoxyribodipyrimidine photo-lyase